MVPESKFPTSGISPLGDRSARHPVSRSASFRLRERGSSPVQAHNPSVDVCTLRRIDRARVSLFALRLVSKRVALSLFTHNPRVTETLGLFVRGYSVLARRRRFGATRWRGARQENPRFLRSPSIPMHAFSPVQDAAPQTRLAVRAWQRIRFRSACHLFPPPETRSIKPALRSSHTPRRSS